MTARDEIAGLINQYSYRVDGGDFEGFRALFEQAEWSVEGAEPSCGGQAIWDNILTKLIVYEDGTPRTRHVTTNVQIEVDEAAGTASAQRYVTVLQSTDALPLQAIFSGHYFDTFVREDGRWRFASTLVRQPFVGDMSHHLKGSEFIDGD